MSNKGLNVTGENLSIDLTGEAVEVTLTGAPSAVSTGSTSEDRVIDPSDPFSGLAPILEVKDLGVEFFVDGEWLPAAIDITYDVRPGEVVAIVGESGSGKTQSSMSLIGLLPTNGRSSGSAKLNGNELLGLSHKQLSSIRGKEIAVIFQEPMTAMNPVYTIGFQIIETLRTHFGTPPKDARARAIELLRMVEIPNPELSVDKYPHQLSGGQRQRAMIAQALACEPKLLIADEPTTALDVTVQAEILKLMRDLRHRVDAGIILITHDMGVVADLSDRVMVMKDGRVVESGTSSEVFYTPQHPYTQSLLKAVPHLGSLSEGSLHAVEVNEPAPADASVGAASEAEYAFESKGLVIEYPARGRQPAFRAFHGLDLTIRRGEVVGLVGESGSGKTTVGRAAVGLLPVHDGSLKVNGVEMGRLRGERLREAREANEEALKGLVGDELRSERRRLAAELKAAAHGLTPAQMRLLRQDVSMVFQDPGSSLNPRIPLGESIGEPLLLAKVFKQSESRAAGVSEGRAIANRVEELLDMVELPRSMRNRYPHELSGGQRQRVGVARSLALSPKLLIADEPTSALDVSVQARVLEIFQELQREHGFACLFISHDLAVVEMLSSRIAVLSKGNLVECDTREEILRNPKKDYTRRLITAVPVPDPEQQKIRREERDRMLMLDAPSTLAAKAAEAKSLAQSVVEEKAATQAVADEARLRRAAGRKGL